jgi:hypothetical protein
VITILNAFTAELVRGKAIWPRLAHNLAAHCTASKPVGVHFAGRYGEEATLLALATELETAQPWFDRVPTL